MAGISSSPLLDPVIPPSPNLSVSEKNDQKSPVQEWLPEAACCSRPYLKAYHTWIQTQGVYRVFKPSPLHQPCDSPPTSISEGWRVTQECSVQIKLVFYFVIWLNLTYCIGRENYFQGTENLSIILADQVIIRLFHLF